MIAMVSRVIVMSLLLGGSFLVPVVVHAASIEEILKDYASEAKKADPSFTQFDAAKGKELYFAERKTSKGKLASCSECHTKDPTKDGKARTGKMIEPIAPSANPKRFTDKAKVEKWFKRNCDDVLERPCTATEKGNFIKFLQTYK